MLRELEFRVPGPPVAWHRTGGKGIRRYKHKQDKSYQKLVGKIAQAAKARQVWSLDGAFMLQIESYVPNRIRRDADNLAKNIMDGLNGILYRDDSLVTELHVTKSVDKSDPHTRVRIWRADPL